MEFKALIISPFPDSRIFHSTTEFPKGDEVSAVVFFFFLNGKKIRVKPLVYNSGIP